MLPQISELAKEFDQVRTAAAAAGLSDLPALVARHAAALDQPFMLYVLGERKAGKSTVINRLADADIAPENGPEETWTNVYRRRRGRYAYAEFHWRGRFDHTDVYPIDQARSLTRGGIAFEKSATADIDRVVWHVDAPALHRDIALVEPPSSGKASEGLWDADGILWISSARTLRADDFSTPTGLTCVRSPHVPRICVVTHMDTLPRAEWLRRLRSIRDRVGSGFDHVVPFGIERDASGQAVGAVSAPLRRSISTWITARAEEIRRKNREHDLENLRRRVASRLELEIDALHASAVEFKSCVCAVHERVQSEVSLLRSQASRYVSLLSDSLARYAAAVEAGRQHHGDFRPPVEGAVFFARMSADLRQIAMETVRMAQTTFLPATSALAVVPTPSLPPPPIPAIDRFALQHAVPPAETGTHRPDDHPAVTPPIEVAIFSPTAEAIVLLGASAARQIDAWLDEAEKSVATSARASVRTAFESRFGCEPDAAFDRLVAIEQALNDIRGFDIRIPAAHLPNTTLTPVQVMWNAQNAHFVDGWNAALMREAMRDVLPDVLRNARSELNRHVDRRRAAWISCEDDLERHLARRWHRHAAELVRSGKTTVSLEWARDLLPVKLRSSVGDLDLSGPPAKHASRQLAALFSNPLSNPSSLELGTAADRYEGVSGQAAHRVRQVLAREADRIDRTPRSLQINLPAPDERSPIAIGLIGLAVLSLVAVLATGHTLWVGIPAVLAVAGIHAIRQQLVERRVLAEAVRRDALDRIHEAVIAEIERSGDRLKRLTHVLERDDEFRVECERAALNIIETDNVDRPSYRSLVRQLCKPLDYSLAA